MHPHDPEFTWGLLQRQSQLQGEGGADWQLRAGESFGDDNPDQVAS